MGITDEALSENIRRNSKDALLERALKLQLIMKDHCKSGVQSSSQFLDEWNSLQTKKWPTDIQNSLDRLIYLFEDFSDIVVTPEYLGYLTTYIDNLNINTRFSKANIKKMKTYQSTKNIFTRKHADIFIRYSMIPYFSLGENQRRFREFMSWLANPRNLLKLSSDEKESIYYSSGQNESIKDPVDSYIYRHKNYEFDETDFFYMMDAVFDQLYKISIQEESQVKEESEKRIKEDIKISYKRRISSDLDFVAFLLQETTTGISIFELDLLMENAAEDTLTAYWSRYNKIHCTWDACIKNNGFYVESMYFFYKRLSMQDSDFLYLIAKSIRDRLYEEYGTFIDEEANICPTAFIEDNCYIKKAVIGDNVYLKNCIINDGVVIEDDSVLDASLVEVEENATLKSGTSIKGENVIFIRTKNP